MWLDKASGAKCYLLSARALSLPWDDGEFSWAWTPHPLSRFFNSFLLTSHEHPSRLISSLCLAKFNSDSVACLFNWEDEDL
jgi:hypothetical protein